MVNHSTNINKTNNQLSRQFIEHKKTITYDVGNPAPGFGQAQRGGRVKPVNGTQCILYRTNYMIFKMY
jgi:hypothetical protein